MPTLNWIGKEAVVEHHKEVPFHLLRCNPELSAGEPGSGNLLVQGDNLLALKALLPYYKGRVKCIYIDPPYNTGNESWVYNDNVTSPEIKAWLGQVVGKEAEDLSRHDKWLCMMYPRLQLLRQFLTEDGVIFISVGKDEIGYLRALADEIFQARNLIEVLVWNTEGHTEKQDQITTVHEYVLAYARDIGQYRLRDVVDPNVPGDSKARRDFAENSITKNGPKNPASVVTLPIGFPCETQTLYLPRFLRFDEFREAVVHNNNCISRRITRDFGARYPVHIDDLEVVDHRVARPCRVYSGWSSLKKLEAFIANACQPIEDGNSLLSFYLSKNGVIYYHREGRTSRYIQSVLRDMGTTERSRYELEAMGVVFPYPKPKELIQYLFEMVTNGQDLILDSFIGSGTTAHAALLLNRKDGGSRRFIGVEMDPSIYRDVTCERIRKVIDGYTVASGVRKGQAVAGIGGGFRSCELGPTLFDAQGQIRDEVSFTDLAHHVFFTETGEPLPQSATLETPLLGAVNGVAVYLLYNGVLEDRSQEGGNVLTQAVLATLPSHDGPRVIYGNGCMLSSAYRQQADITFRQIPYEVKVS